MPYSQRGSTVSAKSGRFARGQSGISNSSRKPANMKTVSRAQSTLSNVSMKSVKGKILRRSQSTRSIGSRASVRSVRSVQKSGQKTPLKRTLSGKSTQSSRSVAMKKVIQRSNTAQSTRSTRSAKSTKTLQKSKSTQSLKSTKSARSIKFARGRPQSQKAVQKPAAMRKTAMRTAPAATRKRAGFNRKESLVKHRSYKTKTGRSVKKQVHAKEFGGPLRPKSGFSLFSDLERVNVTEREKINAKNAGKPFQVTIVGKILGQMWKELPAAEKQKLHDKCAQQKKEYVVLMEEWKKTPDYKRFCKAQQTHTLHRAKVRIQKRLKAAGLPIKPPTAFLSFSVKYMKIVTPELEKKGGKYPSMKERAAAVKALWEDQTPEQKKQWTDLAAQQRAKYADDLAKFKTSAAYKKALSDLNTVNRKAGMALRNNVKGVKGMQQPKPMKAATKAAAKEVAVGDEDFDNYDEALGEDDLLNFGGLDLGEQGLDEHAMNELGVSPEEYDAGDEDYDNMEEGDYLGGDE